MHTNTATAANTTEEVSNITQEVHGATNELITFSGKVNYNYRSKYLFSFAYRQEWSDALNTEKQHTDITKTINGIALSKVFFNKISILLALVHRTLRVC